MWMYWFYWIIAFLPIRIFYPTKVIGRKNLPKKKKAILACNHTSNLDIAVVNIRLYARPYTLAKHTLFKGKFRAALMHSLGAIEVNREEVGLSTVKKVLKILKNDRWLIMFPEGTRNNISEGEQLSLKGGLAMFSIKSGAPIVPMWLMKKPRFLRRNVLLIGEPFRLTQFEGQRLNSEVTAQATVIISQKMQGLRDGYLAECRAKAEAKEQRKRDKKARKTV